MFKEKYRSIIPNEIDPLRNKEKTTYSESYDINGFDNKVKFEIKLLRAEKSNYDVSGNYLYQIKNSSHFDIEAELNFCNSLHFRTLEKNNHDANKTLFRTHIEPYQEIIRKKKKNKEYSRANLCKVQYNRGYNINTRIKLAFTFPSLKKQKSFVFDDHKEIQDNFEIWRKFKPCLIEQLLLFYNENSKKANKLFKKKSTSNIAFNRENEKVEKNDYLNVKKLAISQKNFNYYNILETFARRNGMVDSNFNNYIQSDKDRQNQNPSSKSLNEKSKKNASNYKLASILNSEEIIEGKNFCFVDETFPPCQTDYRIIDLSKELLINPKSTEKDKEKDKDSEFKRKYVVFHYRPIESLNPGSKIIFNKEYVNPFDIKSGLVKNHNIISVFSHLAEYPKLLEKLFEENVVNEIGIYKVKLFFQGSWTPIYMDKFIPCFPLDFPIYTYSPISLWPCILEKALAKIYRSYDNLSRITYFELYQLLTGFPIYNFKRIYRDRENIPNKLNLYEKFKLKDLGNITQNYRYMVNSNLQYNKGSEVVSRDDIINYYIKNNNDKGTKNDNYISLNLNLIDQKNPLNNISEFENKFIFNNNSQFGDNNSYLLGFYATEAYLKYLSDIHGFPINKDMIKLLDKKLFAVKEANRKYVNVKSIYNYQLKQFLKGMFGEEKEEEEDINSNEEKENADKENQNKETDSMAVLWDVILTIFDNVIIVKANKYEEIHFRNAFVRCQDLEFPDHDRILAHTYYELKIRKSGKVTSSKMKYISEGYYKDDKDKNDISFREKKRDSKESLSPSKSSHMKAISKKKVKDFKRKKSSLKIKSMNSGLDSTRNYGIQNTNEIIPVTITLSLSNEHFLDSSFYSKEIDMKLGLIQLTNSPALKEKSEEESPGDEKGTEKGGDKAEKTPEKGGERNTKSNIPCSPANPFKDVTNLNQIISEVFHGKTPILAINPDFQIGHSIVYDLYLEEGTYIVVPMTMGYCMQRNPKIISKNYVISDEKQNPLPMHKTVISKFLDDLFYIYDPFCKNYLSYNIINDITKNIVDNKGKPVHEIDEISLINKYTKIGELDLNSDKFGLSRLSFKNLMYELMSPLNDELKKKCMLNLGYEENTYPYLNRFLSISFYFEKQKGNKPDIITVTPKNNLIDSNMDSVINIKILENAKHNQKVFGPTRVYYTVENDSWYTIEGAYMKKFSNEKKNTASKKYYYVFNNEYYEKKKVFYSTFKNDLRVMMHPGNLLFITYVVEDLLIDKARQDFNEEEEKLEDENNFDEDESNGDLSGNSSSKGSKSEDNSNDKSKSSKESKSNGDSNLKETSKVIIGEGEV